MLFCLGLLDGGGEQQHPQVVGVGPSPVPLHNGFENHSATLVLWVQTSIGGAGVDFKASFPPLVDWIS